MENGIVQTQHQVKYEEWWSEIRDKNNGNTNKKQESLQQLCLWLLFMNFDLKFFIIDANRNDKTHWGGDANSILFLLIRTNIHIFNHLSQTTDIDTNAYKENNRLVSPSSVKLETHNVSQWMHANYKLNRKWTFLHMVNW